MVMYKSFYRAKPAAANLSSLALECANFALSVGFIFLRMCKLLLCAALFVGRIDTPFLAPGIGRLGNLELDNYPAIFLKDVLSHEAHRHPYVELLGVMYLMKLQYGNHFGTRAGSTWRLIFVYALMPWLNKYRITRNHIAAEEVTEDTVRFLSVRNMYYKDDDDDDDDSDAREEAPSSLMSRFQSLRTSFEPEELEKLPAPANLMRRSLTGKNSKRASLLVKELESKQVDELEQEKKELREEVIDLSGQVLNLQDEIKRLQSLLQERKESTEVVDDGQSEDDGSCKSGGDVGETGETSSIFSSPSAEMFEQ